MLRAALRLKYTRLSERPLARKRFKYGSVALYSGKTEFSVIVPKKVARRAVDRNRLKRRIRHIVAQLSHIPHAAAVYPNAEALKAPYADLKESLADALTPR